MENNDKVKDFNENEYKEVDRETRESLEFVRSKIIISRYVTNNYIEIADVGGATGAYSFWLAKMGHHVHLLDLAQNHIDIAKEESRKSGINLASYDCADARELPYTNQSMDLILLMGALYHLHTPEARLMCLSEAYRVLKPGGLVICTVMNRYNSIISPFKYKLFDRFTRSGIEDALKTGIHDKANFYAHTPNELISEMVSANFESIQLIAVEGVANALSDNQLPSDEREASRLLWCIEISESIPDLFGVTRNLIGVGKKRI